MPLRCPPYASFFFPTHIGCVVYSLQTDLNLRAKIDGNGPILMKLRLGEVWCWDDEFRSKHPPSRIFINIGLLSTYYVYNCSLWYHVSSCETRSRFAIGVLFKKKLHNTEVLARRHCHGCWLWCVVFLSVPYALCRGLDICGGISSRTGYAILISSWVVCATPIRYVPCQG